MFDTYEVRFIDNRRDKDEKLYCEFCNYPILSNLDFAASKKYDCCHECFLTFIESDRNNWKKGDRPNSNELDSYIETKGKLCHKVRSIE